MSNVTSRSDFIMQKHFVKKLDTLFYSTNGIIKTKTKNRDISFLLKYFQTLLTICDIIFFADKSKVNSIHLS
jgi:hypothetical protein